MNPQVNSDVFGVPEIIAACGLALCASFVLTYVFILNVLFAGIATTFELAMVRILFFIGVAASYLIGRFLWRGLARAVARPTFSGASAVLLTALALLQVLGATTGFLLLAEAFVLTLAIGLLAGLSVHIWMASCVGTRFEANAATSLIVFLVALVTLALVQLLAAPYSLILFAALPLLWFILWAIWRHSAPAGVSPPPASLDSLRFPKYGHLTVFFYGITLGFVLNAVASLLMDNGYQRPLLAVIVSLVISVLAAALTKLAAKDRNWFPLTIRVLLPPVAMCVLLSLFLPLKTLEIGALVLALGMLGTASTVNIVKLAEIANSTGLPTSYVVGSGRTPLVAGQAAGILLGSVGLINGQPPHGLIQFFSVCVVIALVFIAVYLMPISNAQFEQPANMGDDEPKRTFEDACRICTERFGLSPRESEVLALLARGRNSKYIQDALFISGHTVKTHCNHIYKKMGINSQQEILDLFEEELRR